MNDEVFLILPFPVAGSTHTRTTISSGVAFLLPVMIAPALVTVRGLRYATSPALWFVFTNSRLVVFLEK